LILNELERDEAKSVILLSLPESKEPKPDNQVSVVFMFGLDVRPSRISVPLSRRVLEALLHL
jgi:hypothetical protein